MIQQNSLKRFVILGLFASLAGWSPQLAITADSPESEKPKTSAARETRNISGWTLYISSELLQSEPQLTQKALKLLEQQLEEILRVVPKPAVAELQKVPLYVSPEYTGAKPKAEYHPNPKWLRENGRDPAMAKAVEFTNVRIFEAEVNRMPNFALHELAHAYHDRVLTKGFDHPDVVAAYARAKDSGTYDRVERHNGNGKPNTFERSYAMTNPMEYFAECSEAYFSRNDFYPFTHDELQRHDPLMCELLDQVWHHPTPNN